MNRRMIRSLTSLVVGFICLAGLTGMGGCCGKKCGPCGHGCAKPCCKKPCDQPAEPKKP